MNRLEGKVAIITGAASGIGKATAQLFAREGARVVLGDLAGDDLQQVISQINADGFSAIGQTTDTSKQLSVDELVALAMDNYRQVDVLFNNAGIVGAVEDVADSSDEGWLRVHAVNVLGPVHGVKAVAAKKPIRINHQYRFGCRRQSGGWAQCLQRQQSCSYQLHPNGGL
jgi:NAD(P)-dependent dehydrogenase (short-subunit alcohol dehydrogenase family)